VNPQCTDRHSRSGLGSTLAQDLEHDTHDQDGACEKTDEAEKIEEPEVVGQCRPGIQAEEHRRHNAKRRPDEGEQETIDETGDDRHVVFVGKEPDANGELAAFELTGDPVEVVRGAPQQWREANNLEFGFVSEVVRAGCLVSPELPLGQLANAPAVFLPREHLSFERFVLCHRLSSEWDWK